MSDIPSAADWVRLGEYVTSRRLALNYETRVPFSAASGISTRILGDIETGRRGRFDRKTLAALENTLGWAPGSAIRIANGEEPTLLPTAKPNPQPQDTGHDEPERNDEALIKVMRSDLSDDQKRELVRLLIAEKRRAEQQRVERADELIRLLGGDR